MKHLFKVACITILTGIILISCSDEKCENENELIGTWKLLSSVTTVGEKVETLDLSNQEMIKIITDSHFAFFRHDLNLGKDSTAVFVAGGGGVQFEKNKYKENISYFNYREWEGVVVEFDSEIKGDTLILTGVEKVEELGIDQIITEKYIKLK